MTIDLGFAVDRHDASFQDQISPNKRLALTSGEWESCVFRGGSTRGVVVQIEELRGKHRADVQP
jgi:hypothetical protein